MTPPATVRFVELRSPESEPELVVIRSVLDEAGLPFYVQNDFLGSLLAGPRIAHFNRKRILVHEEDLDEARDLLAAIEGERRAGPEVSEAAAYGALDRIRMVAEFLLFGWFLPGRRPKKRPRLRLVKGFARDDDSRSRTC